MAEPSTGDFTANFSCDAFCDVAVGDPKGGRVSLAVALAMMVRGAAGDDGQATNATGAGPC